MYKTKLKTKLEDFNSVNDFNFTSEELTEYGGEYVEKESCLLTFGIPKGKGIVDWGRNIIQISNEDLFKGKILKIYLKKIFEKINEITSLNEEYNLSFVNGEESSTKINIFVVRTGIYGSCIESRIKNNIYLEVGGWVEEAPVNEYLTRLSCYFYLNDFRKEIGIENKISLEEYKKITRIVWSKMIESKEYKQLISDYKQTIETPLE